MVGQDKVKLENQTKDTGKKSNGVRGVVRETWRGNKRYKMEGRQYHVAECRLIEMG